MLHQQIRDLIKDAMRAKDEVRLRTLRGILSACTNELVSLKRTPQDELSDEEVIAVIRRAVKQRKDSIDQFTKGGRQDLAVSEEEELAVLTPFLPQMMNTDEIEKLALAKKEELGITDKSKSNQLLGSLMRDLKGKADGETVKAVVDKLFD